MSNDENIVTKTNDGYVVELFAKTEEYFEIEEAIEGICILEKDYEKNKKCSAYKEIVEKMDYRPVIIKALELKEEKTKIKTQLKDMLRAGKYGDLSIMFPKVSLLAELREYKDILEECKKELEDENIPYKKNVKMGVMVEIPSVALMSYELARECDFFFIEANSLTNYVFDFKQDDDTKFQLATIKLVQQATEGAHDAGIFCGISGDIVENELYMPLLIGLGLDQFSMNSKNIEKGRKVIGELDKSECKYLVEEILQLRTIEEMEKKLKQFIQK